VHRIVDRVDLAPQQFEIVRPRVHHLGFPGKTGSGFTCATRIWQRKQLPPSLSLVLRICSEINSQSANDRRICVELASRDHRKFSTGRCLSTAFFKDVLPRLIGEC
jgi:hypothetical protein